MNDPDIPSLFDVTSSSPTSKAARMRLKSTVGLLAGLLFASAGSLKLFSFKPFAEYYERWGQPHWVFYASGAVELIAGVALLVPALRVRAARTLLTAIFLVCWQPWRGDFSFVVAQTISIVMLLSLMWSPPARK